MAFAIREYDHDLERDENNNDVLIEFGKPSRIGYFEIIIPSSLSEGQDLAESTVYTPYYNDGAIKLYAAGLALVAASVLI